jgi:hypothetical protein
VRHLFETPDPCPITTHCFGGGPHTLLGRCSILLEPHLKSCLLCYFSDRVLLFCLGPAWPTILLPMPSTQVGGNLMESHLAYLVEMGSYQLFALSGLEP